ncbi:hypothetical protein DFJ73DRAFT_826404 [Zopfochytrium polystomum]|nr:hypothetical protein DFJ73DRAFT_826404 [Zopfochytrium polystomum]
MGDAASASPPPGYAVTADALYCPLWLSGRCRSSLPAVFYIDLLFAACFFAMTVVGIWFVGSLSRIMKARNGRSTGFVHNQAAGPSSSPFVDAFGIPLVLAIVMSFCFSAGFLVSAFASSAMLYAVLFATSNMSMFGCITYFLYMMLRPIVPHVAWLEVYVRMLWSTALPVIPFVVARLYRAVYEDRLKDSWTTDGYADAAVISKISIASYACNGFFALAGIYYVTYIYAVRMAFSKALRDAVGPKLFRKRRNDDSSGEGPSQLSLVGSAHSGPLPPQKSAYKSDVDPGVVPYSFPAAVPGNGLDSSPSYQSTTNLTGGTGTFPRRLSVKRDDSLVSAAILQNGWGDRGGKIPPGNANALPVNPAFVPQSGQNTVPIANRFSSTSSYTTSPSQHVFPAANTPPWSPVSPSYGPSGTTPPPQSLLSKRSSNSLQTTVGSELAGSYSSTFNPHQHAVLPVAVLTHTQSVQKRMVLSPTALHPPSTPFFPTELPPPPGPPPQQPLPPIPSGFKQPFFPPTSATHPSVSGASASSGSSTTAHVHSQSHPNTAGNSAAPRPSTSSAHLLSTLESELQIGSLRTARATMTSVSTFLAISVFASMALVVVAAVGPWKSTDVASVMVWDASAWVCYMCIVVGTSGAYVFLAQMVLREARRSSGRP